MNRRTLLRRTATLGFAAAIPFSGVNLRPSSAASKAAAGADDRPSAPNALKPPAQGSIPVAFLISEGAVVIDFGGPWEVFENVTVPGTSGAAFRLYTVAETLQPVQASGGMKIVPDFTLAKVDPKVAPKSVFAGKTYYFCGQEHKKLFDQDPGKIAQWLTTRERIENWLI